MADWGEVESPRGDGRPGKSDGDASDLKAVAAGVAEFPGPVNFAGVLAIADSLPVMIAYLDRKLRYLFLNRTLAEWLEQPRKEMLGRTMREVLGKKAFDYRKPMLDAALGGEQQWFVADFDHPTRGTLTVQTEYVPQRGPDGEVIGLILVIQDVTEQRATELALRESEARFRRIANSAPLPMWVTRLDGSRDFVNQAFVDFFGFAEDQQGFHDWVGAIHPDDKDAFVTAQVEATKKLEPYDLIARFRRYDGQWRWLRAVAMLRHDPQGHVIGMVGAATDVTEAKEAELALRESEARFRRIADSAPAMMWVTRADRSRDFVNDAYAEFVGLSREEARKLDWRSRIHPDDVERIIAESLAGEASLQPFTLEGRYLRHDGEWRWLRSVSQPRFGGDGAFAGFIGVATDITLAKQAELDLQRQVVERTAELESAQEQLRQSQKMEALGQLTGGIAHDFNNLLTVVVGGLDLLAKQVKEDRLKRYALNALAAAERGARLTAQLLAFSRLQRLEVRPTYVAPLIEEMRPLLRNVLGPGIEKKFDLDPRLTPVLADPTQLELALLNVAINARDAMPDGGTLSFSTCERLISDDSELEPGSYVELAITDTGVGMEADVRERAFEPFFTTKEVGKGTGLGLSMVYGMARQSGGTARIESEPGGGATVRIYLRRAEGEVELAVSDGTTGVQGVPGREGATVLVIDDDEDVRRFIASSLREFGHQVVEAADGTQGIDRYGEARPDLVIVDYIMPGLSGAEVAGHILATRPDQPILFVSGYNETDAIRRVAPDANILAKPFRATALDEAVRAALAAG